MRKPKDKTYPFTIKFTREELSKLTHHAGEMALWTYIKGVIFDAHRKTLCQSRQNYLDTKEP